MYLVPKVPQAKNRFHGGTQKFAQQSNSAARNFVLFREFPRKIALIQQH